MGRLNMDIFNFLKKDDLRILTAIEMGMKNHELVPVSLISSISGLGMSVASLNKILRDLSDKRLISREQAGKRDFGFKLLVSGYDFLALKGLVKGEYITAFGNQIGVGKESDVYVGIDSNDEEIVVKLHRLGRTSFRQIKNKRDYLRHRHHASWLYLSRLSAETEIIIMNALFKAGFPVPKPVSQNRHVVLMEYFKDAVPLYQVKQLENPRRIYEEIIDIMKRMLECGLVHSDFNEFNLLIVPTMEDGVMKEAVRVIDFPQMVSRNHRNAREQYDRDAQCIQSFFEKRFGVVSTEDNDVPPIADFDEVARTGTLDIDLKLSGYRCEVEEEEEEEMEEGESEEAEEEEEKGEEDVTDEEGSEEEVPEGAASDGGSPADSSPSGIRSSVVGRRRRPQHSGVISAAEVRQRVRREANRARRKDANSTARRQMRAQRNAAEERSMRFDLDIW